MQVELRIGGDRISQRRCEPSLEQPAAAPGLDVHGPVGASGDGMRLVKGHTCWCPAGRDFLPARRPGKTHPTDDTNTVMALSTTSSTTLASWRSNVDATVFCAVVCAASAGVHGALVVPHASESILMALAFAWATLALGGTALGLALIPSPATSAAAAALLFAVAGAYLLSRTSGIPGLAAHPEPFDTLGTAISLLEVAAAVVAVRQTNPRRH